MMNRGWKTWLTRSTVAVAAGIALAGTAGAQAAPAQDPPKEGGKIQGETPAGQAVPMPEPTKKAPASDDLGAAGKGNANEGGGGVLGGQGSTGPAQKHNRSERGAPD
jgi:hypothetical protein